MSESDHQGRKRVFRVPTAKSSRPLVGFARVGLRAASHRNCVQTASTSRTSGMKWRSRFWMPYFSVAVDDGQPEQAPRMCR